MDGVHSLRDQRAFLAEALDDCKTILHRPRLGRDPPGVLATRFDTVGALSHRYPPLGAIGRKLDVDDLPGRANRGGESIAARKARGLRAVHCLVRLQLRKYERV